MARTQRVINLLENFMGFHNNGYSILEIAEEFNVDFSTVYNYLGEIANANGVSRKSLLAKPNSKYSDRLHFHKENINIKELEEGFKKLDNDITGIIATINKILQEEL